MADSKPGDDAAAAADASAAEALSRKSARSRARLRRSVERGVAEIARAARKRAEAMRAALASPSESPSESSSEPSSEPSSKPSSKPSSASPLESHAAEALDVGALDVGASLTRSSASVPSLFESVALGEERFGPAGPGYPRTLFGEEFNAARLRETFPADVVFFDIETCGLGDTVIFLVGALRYSPARMAETPLAFEAFFAADPSREREMLEAVAACFAEAPIWVSFNGRSFDLPRLRKRAFRHRVEFPECAEHLDLLIEVRRRWKKELPDCRLGTVERRLLGLERGPDDVPGREVPARYWDFVTTRALPLVEPILEHNRRDVLAMVALLDRLGREGLRVGEAPTLRPKKNGHGEAP